tara:strand:- start:10158 stop:11066 length:909 start_codon:yes stop_codon:yes gene_type:complete
MPIEKINQALILMEKVNSLLREAKDLAQQEPEPVKPAEGLGKPQVSGKETTALDNKKWPMAVNPNLICAVDNEKDKEDRANGVVELMIEENLNGKKFLDYGCGEGHTVHVSTKHKTKISVGYDLVEHDNWSLREGNLTTDINFVKENGPYDVIIMFDVLDHVGPYDDPDAPGNVLKDVAGLLTNKGKIYLRCHPWTARHATHMYHWMNKAYAHLVYTDDELLEMGVKAGEPTQKVTHPIATYRSWVENANLKTENERIIKEPVEAFFKSPAVSKRIIENIGMEGFPEFQMSIQFVDYILSKA